MSKVTTRCVHGSSRTGTGPSFLYTPFTGPTRQLILLVIACGVELEQFYFFSTLSQSVIFSIPFYGVKLVLSHFCRAVGNLLFPTNIYHANRRRDFYGKCVGWRVGWRGCRTRIADPFLTINPHLANQALRGTHLRQLGLFVFVPCGLAQDHVACMLYAIINICMSIGVDSRPLAGRAQKLPPAGSAGPVPARPAPRGPSPPGRLRGARPRQAGSASRPIRGRDGPRPGP